MRPRDALVYLTAMGVPVRHDGSIIVLATRARKAAADDSRPTLLTLRSARREQRGGAGRNRSASDRLRRRRPRLLLAQSDAGTRRLMALALRHDGYEVVEANDGVELLAHILLAGDTTEMRGLVASALRGDEGESYETDAPGPGGAPEALMERRQTYAAVISAVRMPGLSGLDVLALLRCARWSSPVILLTTPADETVGAQAQELGAMTVPAEPFDLDGLRAATRQAVPL